MAVEIRVAALVPCPWPIEMVASLAAAPRSSANLRITPVGSDPADRMNTRGDVVEASAKLPDKSKGGGSIKAEPRVAAT